MNLQLKNFQDKTGKSQSLRLQQKIEEMTMNMNSKKKRNNNKKEKLKKTQRRIKASNNHIKKTIFSFIE